MLSAESAVGNYPIEAVKTMNSIATEVEKAYRQLIESSRTHLKETCLMLLLWLREVAKLLM